MRHAHVPLVAVQTVLWSFHRRQRLAGLVRTMAKEIERLDKDNVQLRAAIKVLREVERRRAVPNKA